MSGKDNGYLVGSQLEKMFRAGHFAVTGELGPPQSADHRSGITSFSYREHEPQANQLELLIDFYHDRSFELQALVLPGAL